MKEKNELVASVEKLKKEADDQKLTLSSRENNLEISLTEKMELQQDKIKLENKIEILNHTIE